MYEKVYCDVWSKCGLRIELFVFSALFWESRGGGRSYVIRPRELLPVAMTAGRASGPLPSTPQALLLAMLFAARVLHLPLNVSASHLPINTTTTSRVPQVHICRAFLCSQLRWRVSLSRPLFCSASTPAPPFTPARKHGQLPRHSLCRARRPSTACPGA
jgi:hypothetical protein